jgi:hypothetical protein
MLSRQDMLVRSLRQFQARPAPLCYARQTTPDAADRPRVYADSLVLVILTVLTSAAVFLVVHAGGGI